MARDDTIQAKDDESAPVVETGTHGHGTGVVHEGEPVASRPAAWDADAAELAAREEGARVAAIPNDNPMTVPGVPGDVIPDTGRFEADVYPPSTVQAPRYDGPLADPSAEHWHGALITGEAQAGHQYPHGGRVHEHTSEDAVTPRLNQYRQMSGEELAEADRSARADSSGDDDRDRTGNQRADETKVAQPDATKKDR